MGQFDHYPDMNHDGKHDLYDCITYIELMEDDEQPDAGTGYCTDPIRPRDLTPEQREQIRLNRQAETMTKWIMYIIFGIFALLCFNNINGFTAFLGLLSVVAFIRTLTL